MFSLYRMKFIAIVIALVLLAINAPNSYSQSCFPTCRSDDGRFLNITEGVGFSTLTPSVLNIRLVVPVEVESFRLGIFDGDHLNGANGEFHWDNGSPITPGTYLYVLKSDPDRDNNGPIIFQTQDTDLLDNDWVDFDIFNDPGAIDDSGNYVYTFSIILTNGVSSSNSFKVRTSQGQLVIEEIFTFIANATGVFDLPIIYPNINFADGIGPDDLVGATYDGTFTFNFQLRDPALELEFWDGDTDRGSFDGTGTDTDDLNTPNVIPDFAPPDSDVVAEGVNPPNPFDDLNPAGSDGFNLLFLRSPAVTYSIIFPDGQRYTSENPSGDQEWEKFSLSTQTSDPNLVDFSPSQIPAGNYQIRFEGLDMGNFVSVNPPFPIQIVGEPMITSEIPTISQWGLISISIAIGIIASSVIIRRRKKVY